MNSRKAKNLSFYFYNFFKKIYLWSKHIFQPRDSSVPNFLSFSQIGSFTLDFIIRRLILSESIVKGFYIDDQQGSDSSFLFFLKPSYFCFPFIIAQLSNIALERTLSED